ncbi:hypothetical protein CHS0354_003088 [Potamilus streckersoni]|uniref:Uncharacterized protein n=1 Tax=Potamilus streckersoni TaxID=2493646 RepID=A0AAE0VGR3_9BIVA|nr:hypothetical protein CHS0354_003088 [Potamilus streckersoni]
MAMATLHMHKHVGIRTRQLLNQLLIFPVPAFDFLDGKQHILPSQWLSSAALASISAGQFEIFAIR